MSALSGLLRKEVYHILRDRRTLTVLVLLPVVQVILFGYSIRTDVSDVRLAIVDPAPDATTLALRDRFTASGVFRIVAVLRSERELDALFRTDTAQVAIEFEPGFAERVARGETARLLVIGDATEPNSGTARQSYVTAVVQQYESEQAGHRGGIRILPEARARFNPTRASANLFVPGLMALVLMIISALMTALSLTREKETGTLEALLVSPLRPWQIIVGKVAPYLVIGFVSVLLVLLEARLVFHVPIRGSVTLLLAEGVLFILVALALGILISARTSSQRVAMMTAMLATMLPTQILSGFVFPLESMPMPLQWLANLVPAKWFVLIARGIMLKGVGITYLWQETLVLVVMALVLMTAASRSFSARLQ
ncbi:MAG TPA: ABC transporter permease [Gemmatimonadaceae bacterium]|nr:ABC transporter permease [Gemmatimonadaceae bacterium]